MLSYIKRSLHSYAIRSFSPLVFRRIFELKKSLVLILGLVGIRSGAERQADSLIDAAVIALNAGDFVLAEEKLRQAAVVKPYDARIAQHLGATRFLKHRAADPVAQASIAEMHKIIGAMNVELTRNPLYTPGEFWSGIGKFHVDLLERYGVENFKRTVAHHYQNWFMDSLRDVQVQELLKLWPTHFATEPWTNIMEVPNNVGMPRRLDDGFCDPQYRHADPEGREIYRIAVGLLWEYVKGLPSSMPLDDLTESDIGNPVRIWRNGKSISSDIAHSFRERNILLDNIGLKGDEGLTVGELGAGHGRLAEMFGRTTNYRHLIFDITPALFVSQWYIKQLFPNEKIFEFRAFENFEEIREELSGCRFAFFSSNQIEKFPNEFFNLFINMNSLAEMKKVQIGNFIKHIDRLTSIGFMSRQQISSFNPVELVHLTKQDFAMPSNWNLSLDTVDVIYPTYFNQVWKKAAKI
jgi:putative sugar O-methyltransferase